jgi:hypothetical protein
MVLLKGEPSNITCLAARSGQSPGPAYEGTRNTMEGGSERGSLDGGRQNGQTARAHRLPRVDQINPQLEDLMVRKYRRAMVWRWFVEQALP